MVVVCGAGEVANAEGGCECNLATAAIGVGVVGAGMVHLRTHTRVCAILTGCGASGAAATWLSTSQSSTAVHDRDLIHKAEQKLEKRLKQVEREASEIMGQVRYCINAAPVCVVPKCLREWRPLLQAVDKLHEVEHGVARRLVDRLKDNTGLDATFNNKLDPVQAVPTLRVKPDYVSSVI